MIRAAILVLIGVGLIAAGSVLIVTNGSLVIAAMCLGLGALIILGAARTGDGGGRHR